MLRTACALCICFIASSAVCEPGAKYEVATIIDVKPHASAADDSASGIASYEISAKVGNTLYVVLYTDTLGTKTIKYSAGRQLLVHVGRNTVTYNDILGQAHELPILDHKSATTTGQSK